MIISFKDLKKLRNKHRGKKIVYSGGTFDLLHKGHVKYFRKLKEIGDIVIVGISSDKRVKQRKGELRPIMSQSERLAVINALKHVDFCFIAPVSVRTKKYPTVIILETLKPDYFVSADKRWMKFKNEIPDYTSLIIQRRDSSISTTKIINRIVQKYKN